MGEQGLKKLFHEWEIVMHSIPETLVENTDGL